jgi:hypothetical protein
MKTMLKIVFLFFFFIISFSWGVRSFKTNSEKNIQNEKGTLNGTELDVEEKTFEIVYESFPIYDIQFLSVVVIEQLFSIKTTIPELVFLTLSNPPPELKLIP